VQSDCTCRGAEARRTSVDLDGFECGIQFQDQPVEVVQGDIEVVVPAVAAGLRETGMLMERRLLHPRLQADGLAHSQDVAGYHLGHASGCRHHVRRALVFWTADTKERDRVLGRASCLCAPGKTNPLKALILHDTHIYTWELLHELILQVFH